MTGEAAVQPERSIFGHFRANVVRGLLALVPLGLSYFVVRLLYLQVDQRVAHWIERIFGVEIPGLGLLLVLVILYLAGLAVGQWWGRRAFGVVEFLTKRIPLVKTVYNVGKQLTDAITLPEKAGFSRVVLVQHFKPGVWSIGFVTGTIADGGKRKSTKDPLLKIFIPTAPNPTTGFMVMVRESEVRELPWSVKDAMNAVISGGLVSPPDLS
jgi:uncharacterized membrane protein